MLAVAHTRHYLVERMLQPEPYLCLGRDFLLDRLLVRGRVLRRCKVLVAHVELQQQRQAGMEGLSAWPGPAERSDGCAAVALQRHTRYGCAGSVM